MTVQSPKPTSAGRNAHWQVLVVDDEAGSADTVASILRSEGYSVRTAYSGGEALDQLRERPADLVLTDMTMPQMDGMQLLANIKEMYPDTDVVVMTASGTIEEAVEAMRRGAIDFLPKPFEPNDLRKLTTSCLAARNAGLDRAFLLRSAALLDLARSLSRTTDPHALPLRVVDLARQNFEADSAILLAYEPAQETLSVLAHSGRSLTRWGHAEEVSAQGLSAIRQKGVILNAQADNGDCCAYIPLFLPDRTLGVLCLRRSGGPWFHERSLEFMEVFSAHLALTLESARLYETAADQVHELEDLMTASRSLSLNTDSERICGRLLTGAARLTPGEICAVLMVRDGETLFRSLPALPDGSPLACAIRAKMQAAMDPAADAAEAGALSRAPAEVRRKLLSFVSAPLESGERRIGILAAFSSRPRCFSTADAQSLFSLADGAAAAAENAVTLERVSGLYHETIELLAGIVDTRCPRSLGHSSQVRTYAGELARALKMAPGEIYLIEDGALLHDVGKMCIPESVLNKAGSLSPEELAVVASHTVIGANLFRNTPHLGSLVPIVRHHHEHFDGKGYPAGLKGEAIPIGARIVAIGDVFDALVSHRTRRPAVEFDAARTMIAERAGSQFDPELTKLFLSLPLEKLTEH